MPKYKYSELPNLTLAKEHENLHKKLGEYTLWSQELETKILAILKDIAEYKSKDDPFFFNNVFMKDLSRAFVEHSEQKHVYQAAIYETVLNLYMLEREFDKRTQN